MGMRCPFCQAKALCYDSRQRKGGFIARRYRCDGCAIRFTTREVIIQPSLPWHPLRGEPFTGVKKRQEQQPA